MDPWKGSLPSEQVQSYCEYNAISIQSVLDEFNHCTVD